MINNRVKMQEVMLKCGNDELKQTKWVFIMINVNFPLFMKINHLNLQ